VLLEAVEGMRWIIRYGVLIRAMYDQHLQFNILEYGLQGSRVIMVDSVQCPVTSLQLSSQSVATGGRPRYTLSLKSRFPTVFPTVVPVTGYISILFVYLHKL